ncbi:hypothetical protein F4560_005047 [Saccharothrix ecbatanensis]|uniref:DUF397 domain-containing protein n=1 Tax=Saccharothrix ecbatanensis TaxID=1105145 RepID=A0A7W9HN00_9PSEU|nr:DUF397 domain-containing protein [Saccharothrix ecbatanensis]MBB5805279.1 hypothetical protein [Saccharothrix ecbatanensis]
MSDQATWRKSARSSSANACVELAVGAARTSVRDSKAVDAGRLDFDRAAWVRFVGLVGRG